MAEWFPKRERAFATGLFNSGTNIGALVTPLDRAVDHAAPGAGTGRSSPPARSASLWLAVWLPLYDSPERIRGSSRRSWRYIQSDPPDPPVSVPWRTLLRHRQTWAFAIGKFMTDPIWWLYLFWIPDFLNRNHGIDLRTIGPAARGDLPRSRTSAASAAAGSRRRSSSAAGRCNAARKTAMLVCALAVVPMALRREARAACGSRSALIGLAAAAHQGWSANLFTLASDMFPRQAVGSVVGFGGMAGAVGGMLIAKLTGYVLEATGSYVPVFMIAASAYLSRSAIIHLLVPRLEPAKVGHRVVGTGIGCLVRCRNSARLTGSSRSTYRRHSIRSSFCRFPLRIAILSLSLRNGAFSTRSMVTGQLKARPCHTRSDRCRPRPPDGATLPPKTPSCR